MLNFNTYKAAFGILASTLFLSFCTHPELPDDFTNLKLFESDLVHMCDEKSEVLCNPQLSIGLAGGHVVSIRITSRGMNQLPKSIYQFQQLRELELSETGFAALPDLRRFTNLRKLAIDNNSFRGPVHLRNLPSNLETLILGRDEITEIVEDTILPHLSWVDISHNRMHRLTPPFCKLPRLENLVVYGGCCLSEEQEEKLRNEAKQILCNKQVAVQVQTSID